MAPKNFVIIILALCSSLLLVSGIGIVFGIAFYDICTQRFCLALAEFIQFYQTIFFTFGVILTSVAAFGFLAMIYENRNMLDLYGKLLIFVLLMLFLILWLGLWGKGPSYLRSILTESFKLYDKGNCRLVAAIDHLQNKFRCCGIDKPSDWDFLRPHKLEGNKSVDPPVSCCNGNYLLSQRSEVTCISTFPLGCMRPVCNYIWKAVNVASIVGTFIAMSTTVACICSFRLKRNLDSIPYISANHSNVEANTANDMENASSPFYDLKDGSEIKKAASSTVV